MPPAFREQDRGYHGEIRPNDDPSGFAPRFLITGFGPFPGVPVNPSETLARRIAGMQSWQRLGWTPRVTTFRTGYTLVAEAIKRDANQKPIPAFVIMLGVAARAKWVRIELRAMNRVSSTQRDATRARPGNTLLKPGAETTRFGRHPGPVLVRALRGAQVPARLSRDTGRYVCNAGYWRMLGKMPKATEVVFIHIPLPAKPGARKRDPRPTMESMTRGIAAVVRVMMMRARLG